jgi:hypothetical protein
MTRQLTALTVIASLLAPVALLAVDKDRAAYFGGTTAVFVGASDPIDADLDTTEATHLVLTGRKDPYKGVALRIPYAAMTDLEYGQKAGRRVGAAIGTTVLLGPIGLLTLFSKKRSHYLTIAWRDGETEQVAVIELGKEIVRTTLPIVKARSGQAITFQDEDARKEAKIEPSESIRARNLLTKDDCRAALAYEFEPRRPKMARIVGAIAFPRRRERLTGTTAGPALSIVWPSSEPQRIAPSANAGEEVTLRESSEVVRSNIND